MNKTQLLQQIHQKKSMLCVGLDTDPKKIPSHLRDAEDPVFEFNKAIIDATHEYAVAYKPNLAFYEAQGLGGWQSLQRTMLYLNEAYPDVFTIADAKRGDIGNTATQYAKAFFEQLNFDSITVAPYMGEDSVSPFLQFSGKWAILLALTSNPGGNDFQTIASEDGEMLFEQVLKKSSRWGTPENLMYVVGATRADYLQRIRKIIPDNFLLVPGVGAQGGDLREVVAHGMGNAPNLLINSSRGIIYASDGESFADAAAEQAKKLQKSMAEFL